MPPKLSALFDRCAADYAQHAAVQTEAGSRLLERLDGLNFQPSRILEIGCADGRQCQALHQRFPKAKLVAVDCSQGMLKRARKRRRWWRRDFELLCGDGARLPLAEDSFDLLYAHLSLGWLDDVAAALQSWRRVLRPGGLLLASVYGPDTLKDWRDALTIGYPLIDVQTFGSALVRAGFAEPVLDTDWLTSVHPNRAALLADLRGAGLLPALTPGLASRARRQLLQSFNDGAKTGASACRAAWEIVSASAWAPEPGQAFRSDQGDIASIPVTSIGVRRRQA
ncbi:MAG: methyltransferase domain-containing protein [Wenzhouxiangella sp.]